VRAARVFNLGLAGVDILRSHDGPKVLEVNSSPGLEGIELATGKNIAALLYDAIERKVRPMPLRKRRADAA
jgi:ribosomal protein S6--L-glutamate ligase